jgi:hypothetical protein
LLHQIIVKWHLLVRKLGAISRLPRVYYLI